MKAEREREGNAGTRSSKQPRKLSESARFMEDSGSFRMCEGGTMHGHEVTYTANKPDTIHNPQSATYIWSGDHHAPLCRRVHA